MRRQPLRAAGGFTLMEMLVTLVIFALVSGLLWQALATVARIEGNMAVWTRGDRDTALREEWLRELLRGLATGPRGDAARFRGGRDVLAGYSNMPPWPGTTGPMLVELRLLGDEPSGGTTLVARDGKGGRTLALFAWETPAHFEYLDDAGVWHEVWAPADDSLTPLPAAVRLAGVPGGDFLVAVQTMTNPMVRRVDVEQP